MRGFNLFIPFARTDYLFETQHPLTEEQLVNELESVVKVALESLSGVEKSAKNFCAVQDKNGNGGHLVFLIGFLHTDSGPKKWAYIDRAGLCFYDWHDDMGKYLYF